jgi:hypothetical protein
MTACTAGLRIGRWSGVHVAGGSRLLRRGER